MAREPRSAGAMTLTFGSLFAGVGGADLGMEQAGFECVFQVEWDKHCQSILRRHWPDVPKWGDVCEVSGHDLPEADVIFFGSPCQDLSVAGKRAGLDGGRSSMFFEATRIIKEMRDATASRPTGPVPRAVIWENVPGALSSNNGEDFQAVLKALGDIGAVDIQWSVLDAQHFGVPQRRRRIFLVAIFDPATADRCDGPLLPVCEGRPRDFAKGRAKGEGATGGAEASPDGSGAIPFVKAKRAMSDTDDDRWEATETAPTLRAEAKRGDNEPHIAQPYSFDTQFGSNANVFVDQSPTLKASQQSPSIATTMAVRRLTPLECERLMGFPDDHTRWTDEGKEQADTHRYKQCGNAVASPVARWVGQHVRRVL